MAISEIYLANAIASDITKAYLGGTLVYTRSSGSYTDLFVIVGQSNAEGQGDIADSIAAPNSIQMGTGGAITEEPFTDPFASNGSMWPAFGNEWFAQTGRKSAFVDRAGSGTDLIPDSTSEWGSNGASRAAAATTATDCIATLTASGDYDLGNVYFIWLQGENESQDINGTTITGVIYEAALETLASYFKTNVPTMTSMAVIHTGQIANPVGDLVRDLQKTGHGDDVLGFAEIRVAQSRAINDSANLVKTYSGLARFPSIGYMEDSLHYSQLALNIAGKAVARQLNSLVEPVLTSPYIGFAKFIQSANSNSSGGTLSHTTSADTTCLIVAHSGIKYSAAISADFTATFNGVSMKLAGLCTSEVSGGVTNSIFYLNEDLYGGSLANITANIVVTSSSVENINHFVAINAKGAYAPDNVTGIWDTGGTTDADLSLTPIEDSLIIVIHGCTVADTDAHTASTSGYTKIVDEGLARTKVGHITVGYVHSAALAENTIDFTFDDTMQEVSALAVAFRGKIDGE